MPGALFHTFSICYMMHAPYFYRPIGTRCVIWSILHWLPLLPRKIPGILLDWQAWPTFYTWPSISMGILTHDNQARKSVNLQPLHYPGLYIVNKNNQLKRRLPSLSSDLQGSDVLRLGKANSLIWTHAQGQLFDLVQAKHLNIIK